MKKSVIKHAKLPSAEEFNFMLSSVARDAAYAAALARVAELEAWQEVSLTMAEETHEVMDVVATQRDTALAELAVLRAALEQIARGPDDPRNYPARDTSIESHYEIVAIRALTALHEAEQERDTALARVAEKEAEKERQAGLSSGGASPSAYQHAIDRADALAVELSELREGLASIFANLDDPEKHSIFDSFAHEDGLRTLAAQPQGERGKALLAVVKAVAKLDEIGKKFSSVYSPRFEEFIGAVNEALGAYAALAAIDGAQSDG